METGRTCSRRANRNTLNSARVLTAEEFRTYLNASYKIPASLTLVDEFLLLPRQHTAPCRICSHALNASSRACIVTKSAYSPSALTSMPHAPARRVNQSCIAARPVVDHAPYEASYPTLAERYRQGQVETDTALRQALAVFELAIKGDSVRPAAHIKHATEECTAHAPRSVLQAGSLTTRLRNSGLRRTSEEKNQEHDNDIFSENVETKKEEIPGMNHEFESREYDAATEAATGTKKLRGINNQETGMADPYRWAAEENARLSDEFRQCKTDLVKIQWKYEKLERDMRDAATEHHKLQQKFDYHQKETRSLIENAAKERDQKEEIDAALKHSYGCLLKNAKKSEDQKIDGDKWRNINSLDNDRKETAYCSDSIDLKHVIPVMLASHTEQIDWFLHSGRAEDSYSVGTTSTIADLVCAFAKIAPDGGCNSLALQVYLHLRINELLTEWISLEYHSELDKVMQKALVMEMHVFAQYVRDVAYSLDGISDANRTSDREKQEARVLGRQQSNSRNAEGILKRTVQQTLRERAAIDIRQQRPTDPMSPADVNSATPTNEKSVNQTATNSLTTVPSFSKSWILNRPSGDSAYGSTFENIPWRERPIDGGQGMRTDHTLTRIGNQRDKAVETHTTNNSTSAGRTGSCCSVKVAVGPIPARQATSEQDADPPTIPFSQLNCWMKSEDHERWEGEANHPRKSDCKTNRWIQGHPSNASKLSLEFNQQESIWYGPRLDKQEMTGTSSNMNVGICPKIFDKAVAGPTATTLDDRLSIASTVHPIWNVVGEESSLQSSVSKLRAHANGHFPERAQKMHSFSKEGWESQYHLAPQAYYIQESLRSSATFLCGVSEEKLAASKGKLDVDDHNDITDAEWEYAVPIVDLAAQDESIGNEIQTSAQHAARGDDERVTNSNDANLLAGGTNKNDDITVFKWEQVIPIKGVSAYTLRNTKETEKSEQVASRSDKTLASTSLEANHSSIRRNRKGSQTPSAKRKSASIGAMRRVATINAWASKSPSCGSTSISRKLMMRMGRHSQYSSSHAYPGENSKGHCNNLGRSGASLEVYFPRETEEQFHANSPQAPNARTTPDDNIHIDKDNTITQGEDASSADAREEIIIIDNEPVLRMRTLLAQPFIGESTLQIGAVQQQASERTPYHARSEQERRTEFDPDDFISQSTTSLTEESEILMASNEATNSQAYAMVNSEHTMDDTTTLPGRGRQN